MNVSSVTDLGLGSLSTGSDVRRRYCAFDVYCAFDEVFGIWLTDAIGVVDQ